MRSTEFFRDALASAIKSQLEAATDAEALETLRNVQRGGADGGFAGFTYYRDTCEFARANLGLILTQLQEDLSNGMGGDAKTVSEMIATFKYMRTNEITAAEIEQCLIDHDDDSDVGIQVYNTLAWYALELVASRADEVRADDDADDDEE